MRVAVIKDGYIVNVILMEEGSDLSAYPDRIPLPEGKGIGDSIYDDEPEETEAEPTTAELLNILMGVEE